MCRNTGRVLGKLRQKVSRTAPKPGDYKETMDSDNRNQWQRGLRGELDHWAEVARTGGSKWPDDWKQRQDPDSQLDPGIAKYLSVDLTRAPRVLDVGAGPLTILGKKLGKEQLTIVAVDPLAHEYDAILRECGIDPPVRTTFGEVEKLSEFLPENYFDLVYMRNALDHSNDPLTGIKEMLKVVRPNCYVLLFHYANGGEKAKYADLHRWNLCVENNHFTIWNPTARVWVDEELRGVAKVEARQEDGWVSCQIQKIA